MAVTMICPNLACRQTVMAAESARGKIVRCAYCNQPFLVPAREGAAPNPGEKPREKNRK